MSSFAEVTAEMEAALHVIKDQNTKRTRTNLKLEGWVDLIWHLQLVAHQMLEQVQVISSPFFLPRTAPRSQPALDSDNEKKRKEADMAIKRFW
jgi:hypothetical protein